MKKTTKIIMMVTLIALPLITHAMSVKGYRPTFRGSIMLPGNLKCSFDTIEIQYLRPYSPLGIVSLKVDAVADKEGNFSFNLPDYIEPVKMIINVLHNGSYRRINDGYFVEASDDIYMTITKYEKGDSVKFDGLGAEKYNIANQLYLLYEAFGNERTAIKLYEPDRLAMKLQLFNHLIERYENEKYSMLKNAKMSDKIKKIFNYEYCCFFSNWDAIYWQYYTTNYKDNQLLRSILRNSFNQYGSKFTYKTDSVMNLCNLYLLRLALREARGMLINDNSNIVDLVSYYNKLKTKYTGLLRERLITNLFIGNAGFLPETKFTPFILDSLMQDGEKFITIPFVKEIYSDKLRLSKGKKLFNATFTGLDGKMVNTASLKGKVILIDMWSEGCSWCAIFHKAFHKDYYPSLKDNKDFVYLSISADPSKERWQNGIKSGQYSSPEYLNVSTGGLGINHPFCKYYNITGLPFVILIDKMGNIYSRNPGSTPAETVLYIKEALGN